jgi:non-ribosomal peptide synthetase component F
LPAQYADFALWQRNWLQGKELERLITYWQGQLRGAQELELPTDRPRPAVSTFQGATYSFTYPQELTQQLQKLSQQEGVTLFMTLLTAFNILLYRQTNQEDIVLGTDIANRTLSETELMIGFFVNLLVLRTHLGGKPGFREALKRVREMVLGAYAHQDLPFEKLVEALHLDRSLNRTPLVRCLFVMQNVPLYYTEGAGLTLSPFQGDLLTAKFDFVIFLFETEQGIQGSVNYSTELFDKGTIQRMMQRFEVLLHSIVAQPHAQIDALDCSTEQEKASQHRETQTQHHALRRKLKAARREEIVLPL